MVWILGARRERRRQAADQLRVRRRMVREDVSVFGEQLVDLDGETFTVELDEDMRADYQAALDAYDDAKAALGTAEDEAGLRLVDAMLDDGRFAAARVLARRDGEPLPERRGPCFFNPQHGPAVADVPWTPPGGVEREVPLCRSDQRRLTEGYLPQVRMVRVGDRLIPWWAVGDPSSVLLRRNHATTQHQRYLHYEAMVANIRDITSNI
jgi:hypothetical protein